ncbi:ATP-binding protein [Komagataeibacter rhaeticus]|nr:ATP-binding protein [Komagataeibacter rhaeticus]
MPGARIILLPHRGAGDDADEYRVTILIEDEGPGLPTEDLERMFDPFVRAEQSRNRETGARGWDCRSRATSYGDWVAISG